MWFQEGHLFKLFLRHRSREELVCDVIGGVVTVDEAGRVGEEPRLVTLLHRANPTNSLLLLGCF